MMTHEQQKQILSALHILNEQHKGMHDDLHAIRQNVLLLTHLITGNGEPSKGLLVRTDRLEQDARRKEAWTKAAIGSSVAAVFAFIGLLVKLIYK